MVPTVDELNRIEKLFVDRDGIDPIEARHILRRTRVCLCFDDSIEFSPTLQAAILTAAVTAVRCFPGSVSFVRTDRITPPKVRWNPNTSLTSVLRSVGVTECNEPPSSAKSIVVGSETTSLDGIRISFDGWIAHVSPINRNRRLAERGNCTLAGVAAGAIAVSEIFLNASRITPEAGSREFGLSLWRPDLAWNDCESLGPRLEYLPSELRLLGLGHLGQAYAWCLSFLPFQRPSEVKLLLNDHDRIKRANVATGVLSLESDIGLRKTAVVSQWLTNRGFDPGVVDSPFQPQYRWQAPDPRVALCGFDGSGPRHCFDDVDFTYVAEAGLGGRFDNFDTIALHAFPNGKARACEIWNQNSRGMTEITESLATRNKYYRAYAQQNQCGHLELAGKAVAVPFVGAVAGALVLSDILRVLHGGNRYSSALLRLASPGDMRTHAAAEHLKINIPFVPVA